ncbi:MAG: zinc/iron permease [Clostridia bacterium]|jgi:ZIP family zinc transporter|nr:zinc/iron permease [Clostridia bacterium]
MSFFGSKLSICPYIFIVGGIGMSIWLIGFIALVAEGMGLAIGIVLLYVFKVRSKRVIGMLFGGTSGLMIALICFDVLPQALSKERMDLIIIGIMIGVTIGLLLDDITPAFEKMIRVENSRMIRTAFTLVIGIALHNIPEGFALGALSNASADIIQKFAVILALHSIPEGIALAIPFKQAKVKLLGVLVIPIILGSIMGVGGLLGYVLSSMSQTFIIIALGLAAGIILYIVCDELIPESRKIWNGRMTTVATILGIVLGLLLLK